MIAEKTIMDGIGRIVTDMEANAMETRAEAIAAQTIFVRRLFAYTQLTTLAGFAALLYLLAHARRVAEELRIEVANRHSADELAQERAEQALRMRVMNRELVHRTKNLISVVQAIVRNQRRARRKSIASWLACPAASFHWAQLWIFWCARIGAK